MAGTVGDPYHEDAYLHYVMAHVPPLTQLAGLLFNAYASGQLKNVVQSATPVVDTMLKDSVLYVDALSALFRATNSDRKQTLAAVEAAMKVSDDARHLVAFYRFARGLDITIYDSHRVLDGYKNVLVELQNANTTLATTRSG
jgi:hypothetical protein